MKKSWSLIVHAAPISDANKIIVCLVIIILIVGDNDFL